MGSILGFPVSIRGCTPEFTECWGSIVDGLVSVLQGSAACELDSTYSPVPRALLGVSRG